MSEIKIYDRETIGQLEWPEGVEGDFAKAHLLPLIQEGTESFIANARTRLYLLKIDHWVIPLTVNEAEYQNCYLLNSYFVAANLKEKNEQSQHWKAFFAKPLLGLFGSLLKAVKINRVVIINNWLFTTNPYPDLSHAQIQAITHFLQLQFPDHCLMFRSVNTYKGEAVYEALQASQFRMIPCRNVYLYDPSQTATLSSSILRKQKKDSNRLSSRKYDVEEVSSLTPSEIGRLLELYRNVYVDKYSSYSPLYTDKFLLSGLKNRTFRLKLLKKEGIIYGVAGFLEKDGYLLVPFFGYDTSIPQEEGLYRMLSAIIMQEIERSQLISHQGSGAGQFKKWRGFFEQVEYVGIYDRHLPLSRRLFWTLSHKFSPRFFEEKPAAELQESADG